MSKKILTKENIFALIFIIVALHPIIELDYMLADAVPVRLTTIIDLVVLPLAVLLVFFLCENNKKKTLILFGIYVLIFGIYFFIHCKAAADIQNHIHLTPNFYFSIYDEIVYTIILLLPLVMFMFFICQTSVSRY